MEKSSVLAFIALLGQLTLGQCSAKQLVTMMVEGESETLVFNNLENGRERYFNGSLTILEDLDDEDVGFTVEMHTSPNGDGNYKNGHG
ncbi:hypothetical protein EVAR_72012_1 [Eumeta japonica]|uniref:Uncharacterized protein n=1 Tax=Eumeta variegata TaxID=151549 RepID=A0A4C1T4L5_EUMVA|nr:hypothetical protein EVAR_72012_1 [Eumeta japonica]